jgi:Fe(3+) dicitrate transport protein
VRVIRSRFEPAPTQALRRRFRLHVGLLGLACFALSSRALTQPAEPEPQPTAPAAPPAAPGVAESTGTPIPALPPEGSADTAPGDENVEASQAEATESSQPDAPVEVTVVGSRARRAPGSVHVIGQKTLDRFKYDDAQATLQLVPGVYVRQEDGVGLRPNIGIRGALSDRSKKLTLLEDGILFAPAPYSAPAAYYFPLMPRVYQIRVIKGPSAISYGPQTIGGAIDFITRPIPGSPSAMFDVAVGQYGYAKLHGWAGTSDMTNGVLIEGIHVSSDGFKELPSGADTGFARNEWMFKGSHNLDPTSSRLHELQLKVTYSDEISNETYLGLTDDDFQANPLARYSASSLDRMRWYHTSVVLTHKIEPTKDLAITTNAYRHDFHRVWRKVNHFRGAALFEVLRDPDDPANTPFYDIISGQADTTSPAQALFIGPNERDFVSQGVESRFKLEASTGPVQHRIEYGIRLHHDRIERRHSEDAFNLIQGELYPEGTATIVTAFNEASSTAVAMHALDAITLGPLTLTPGVRAELVYSTLTDKLAGTRSGASNQSFLPGVGAYFALTDGLGLLGGVYRGMSPTPPGAEQSIEPESSINYEAGVRFAQGTQRAELIGYYNDYSNMTDVCTFSSGCVNEDLDRQFDAGRARIYGLEAFVEDEVAVGPLKLLPSVAYTLTLTEFLQTFESDDPIFGDVEAGDEMPYVPKHEARINLALELGPASGYGALMYVSKMREEAGAGPIEFALHTDEQVTFDAGLSYQLPLPIRTTLYLQGRNLFDNVTLASRRPYGARPNPPRWVQGGVKVEF